MNYSGAEYGTWPTCALIMHTFSQLSLSEKQMQTLIHTLQWYEYSHKPALHGCIHDNPCLYQRKRRNQENMQHWEAELDQRWDRYCSNNTAMADLQISLFRAFA